jgi:hypothetical protein
MNTGSLYQALSVRFGCRYLPKRLAAAGRSGTFRHRAVNVARKLSLMKHPE